MNYWHRYGLALLTLLLSILHSSAQGGLRVSEIAVQHVGPPAVSDSLIRSNIRTKPGDTFSAIAIDNDVRNLYATGYFDVVQVSQQTSVDGVKVIYIVRGKPLLTNIRFEGSTKFKDSKLLKRISSEVGEPLEERQLFEDAQSIKKLYQSKGYPNTEVTYAPPSIDEQAGRATATFEIVEAPKVKIDDVVFEGATAFSQRELRKVFKKTRRWWMFSWLTSNGFFKEAEFDDDQQRLVEHYRNEGYLDFRIDDVIIEYPEPDKMIVRIQVFEGTQYRVGTVGFENATVVNTNELIDGVRLRGGGRSGLELVPGEVFTPDNFRGDIDFIQNAYGREGFIDARVRARRLPNTTTGNIDLVYEIEENDKIFIERIDVRGNTKTKDRVIRRELSVAPGDVFDMVSVRVSTNRLGGLAYFDRISATAEPTDIPNRRHLLISVDEGNTGNIQVGAGVSTIDSVVGYVELSQGNFDLFNPPYFTGGGQKMRLRVQMGTERQDYQLSFIEPWFLGRKLIFGQDLYHRDLDFQSSIYRERRTGASTSLTRALGSDFLRGTVSYTIEEVGILDVDPAASQSIRDEEGERLVSKAGLSFDYDRRGPGFLPKYGYRSQLITELAGGPFGADTDFYRLELRHAHYFPGFFEGHVIELLGRIGVVESYGDSPRVPLFDRNYLGGAFSMRGFDYRDVGPKDGDGEPLGGSTYWFASAEYSIPVIDRIRFAAFYDIGMVYQDPYSFDSDVYDNSGNFIMNTDSFNDNFGIGLRLDLPIGPLVLDYGIPLNSDSVNDSSGRFQFRAGYTREF